jgi:hypothetical protein
MVRVIGLMEVVPDYNEEGRWNGEYVTRLTPNSFVPSLTLIEVTDAFPKGVTRRIGSASKVLWMDPSSAANRLRSAIEALMDEHGIPRKRLDRHRRIVEISLHERIGNFKKAKTEYAEAADLLLAVKWIGNVGSHDDRMRVDDVLDGAELLDHALEAIYDTYRDEIKKKAMEITARRGVPVRRSV